MRGMPEGMEKSVRTERDVKGKTVVGSRLVGQLVNIFLRPLLSWWVWPQHVLFWLRSKAGG